jgi:hypothetical protein
MLSGGTRGLTPLAKLDLRDRIGAVIVAYVSGLIEIGDPQAP